jgi:hypothetical protein
MKPTLALLLGLTASVVGSAQTLTSAGGVVAGGGGTSAGGAYSLGGTAGEPGAGGPLTGGAYSLVGGFWALPVIVPTADAPTLAVVAGAEFGTAVLTWPAVPAGFVLQQAADPEADDWQTVPEAVSPWTVPASFPVRLYRLIKP